LRHYRRKVEDLVFTNLSRLASQWADIVNASLLALDRPPTAISACADFLDGGPIVAHRSPTD